MPSKLIIEETELTPRIHLDNEAGVFEISGRSLPEDSLSFYFPVQEWMDDYRNNPNNETEFKMKLDYFNSASAKQLLKIIKKLIQIVESGKDCRVTWYYTKDDDIMKDRGLEIKSISDITFELKEY